MSGREELDPYRSSGDRPRVVIGRVIARGLGILIGLGIGFYGVALYVLRCFSYCPSDPAENAISQILTLSIVGLGAVVVTAAASLGTRWATPGTWMVSILGALMGIGGVVTSALAPSLHFPGDRTASMMFGIIDLTVGAGVVLMAAWVRSRSEQRVAHSLKTRAAAIVLGAAAFMPWYSSQAIVDHETYLGNPLPLIDWVVLAAAVAVLVRPRLATVAAAVGLIDVGLGALAMWVDSAEGIQVSLQPGFPLAFVACLGLLLFQPNMEQRQLD